MEELMKRRYAFGTVLAFALAVCGAANGSASQDTYGQTADRHAKEIVVAGCLLPGAASPTGTTGTTGTTGSAASASPSAAGFILTNATIASGGSATSTTAGSMAGSAGSAGSTVGTSGSAVPETTAGSGSTFTLIGKEKELEKNVNSKVEIHGTLEPESASNPPSTSGAASTAGAAASAAATPGTPDATAHNQVLRVSSVKKLEGSCSGSQK